MIDLEGLLGGPTPPSTAAIAGAGAVGGGEELSLDRATAGVGAAAPGGGVDLAKHPSGIVPVLQYKKSIYGARACSLAWFSWVGTLWLRSI